jgi:hypothetical protein
MRRSPIFERGAPPRAQTLAEINVGFEADGMEFLSGRG